MVIFGPSVFYFFGPLVICSALRFSIFLALWIRPYGPVQFLALEKFEHPYSLQTKIVNFRLKKIGNPVLE